MATKVLFTEAQSVVTLKTVLIAFQIIKTSKSNYNIQPLSPLPPSEGLEIAFPVWYPGTQVFVYIHQVKCKSNLAALPHIAV